MEFKRASLQHINYDIYLLTAKREPGCEQRETRRLLFSFSCLDDSLLSDRQTVSSKCFLITIFSLLEWINSAPTTLVPALLVFILFIWVVLVLLSLIELKTFFSHLSVNLP